MRKRIDLLRFWRCVKKSCKFSRQKEAQRATFTVAGLEKALRNRPHCKGCGRKLVPRKPPPYSDADRKAFILRFHQQTSIPTSTSASIKEGVDDKSPRP